MVFKTVKYAILKAELENKIKLIEEKYENSIDKSLNLDLALSDNEIATERGRQEVYEEMLQVLCDLYTILTD